ncbi:MAG: PD40 domain-containing protein [Chitinophagales bacterium]|nr:PD40 domain-containing protein [Chitinophagales bacterium]
MIKRYTTLLFAVVLIASSAIAQKASTRMGDLYFKQFDFKKAIEYYSAAIKKDSSQSYVRQQIADSYRLLNDWQSAEPWYKLLAQDQTTNPINKMYYAEALRANQKYAEAKLAYKSYLSASPNDASVKERILGVDKVADLSVDKGLYSIENLPCNSAKSDYGPMFYTTNQLIFTSNRATPGRYRVEDNWTDEGFSQEFVSSPDANGNYTTASVLTGKAPNGKYHEGPTSYNAKMQELYITRSNYIKRPQSSSDKTVKLKLYRLVYLPSEQRWGDDLIEAVPFNDREYSVAHPALTADGQTLYFSSDKPGGFGGMDLYKTIRDKSGNWTAPENLGVTINTSGDEMFPYVSNDGVLYFASNGHLGLGGLDVFSATQSSTGKKDWAQPENLGYPINTNSDDFGYIIDKDNKTGYFASNRPGGQGDDDIYKFIKKGITICGLVYDAKTNDPIEASKVVMYELKDEKGNKLTSKDGNFCFAGTPKRTYKIVATKEGYLPNEIIVETQDQPVSVKIPLVKEGGLNLEVLVVDKKTREPIDMALVKLVNVATSKVEPQKTSPEGKVFYTLDPNTQYRIEASKDLGDPETKYLTVSTTTSTVGKVAPATIYATLELEKVKKGVAIKIENIYYDLDKWFIRPDAAKELDKIVKVLSDNPTMEIELSSHTDCRATIKYNASLSAKRAEAAVQYIASRGISQTRMVAAGYGESRLVNKCACEGTQVVPCTEEQHQENRRTEFKILKF